jgi:hypothetical protein
MRAPCIGRKIAHIDIVNMRAHFVGVCEFASLDGGVGIDSGPFGHVTRFRVQHANLYFFLCGVLVGVRSFPHHGAFLKDR